MGNQGRIVVRNLFGPEVMVRAIDETYRGLLGIPHEPEPESEDRIVVLPDVSPVMRVSGDGR